MGVGKVGKWGTGKLGLGEWGLEDLASPLAQRGLPNPLMSSVGSTAHSAKTVQTLVGEFHVAAYSRVCRTPGCNDNGTHFHAGGHLQVSPPYSTYGLDVKAWLPHILHCYDIPGLPRSNLDLESAFGSLRRGQRRTSDRKETALVCIFGPGEIVLLSLEDKDILPLLQSAPADVYWSQRRRQEECKEPRRWLRRMHRDPLRALTQVDQQFYQVVSAHTRASANTS